MFSNIKVFSSGDSLTECIRTLIRTPELSYSASIAVYGLVKGCASIAVAVNVSPLSDSVAVKAKKSLSGAGVSVVCGISGVFVGSGILVDSGVFVGSGVLVTSGIVTGFSDGITDTSPDHTESTDPYSSSSNKRKPYLY